MDISAIYQLMGGDGIETISQLRKLNRSEVIFEAEKQYNPKLHKVADARLRPDKQIMKPHPTDIDEVTKEPKLISTTSPVARVPLAFQKYIIDQKSAFAVGNGVTLKPNIQDSLTFDYVKGNWKKNKLDYVIGDIATRQMSETQVALIFHSEPAESIDKFRLHHLIASPMLGDKITPYFDEYKDLIAFSREYVVGKKTRFDLYAMNDQGTCDIFRYVNNAIEVVTGVGLSDANWVQEGEVIKTPYTNLPIIYWEQDAPECDDTNELQEEFEKGFSDYLTQMGYTADPILFGKGDSLSMPAAGSPGKFITGKGDADLKYITPENATESRELQFRMLQRFIFSLNRAVLLDLDTMKDLGDVSGAALDRYLIDAYMEATSKQRGSWGMGVQRIANFMLSVWKTLVPDEDLEIEVVFSKYSIEDIKDRIELAMKANGGLPVIDHEASIQMAGQSDDTNDTFEKIKAQAVAPVNEVGNDI